MNKHPKPKIDFKQITALTSAVATPMQEATQRTAAVPELPKREGGTTKILKDDAQTKNLLDLNFKVPKAFRRRYQRSAFDADMKQNAFLFHLLDFWEQNRYR